ncbi:UDP-glucoronosyl and UDP-glucosyl transferase domain-containing protein [Phthorimaea operculella]|nr:UDP-glucoronosyl and UDP-glucosyl transferase domain-containing protein [Phthorimaea operculella]
MRLLCVVALVAFTAKVDSAKILAYIPTPSISHQAPFRSLFQELAKRGHDVNVITTDPAFPKGQTPPNLTEYDVHDVSYGTMLKQFQEMSQGVKANLVNQIRHVMFMYVKLIDDQLNTTEMQTAIHGKKYDLLMIEVTCRPALALAQLHKVPVILLNSLGAEYNILHVFGAPGTHPFLYPSMMQQRIYNLTVWEKLDNLYKLWQLSDVGEVTEDIENEMLKKYFGDNLPHVNDFFKNVDMLFLNTHPMFDDNRPLPPSVVYIWGINSKPQKELPKDLKDLLDSSKNGVIYMSFGTNTDPALLPGDVISKFVKVFCELPYDVLWKWNRDELPGKCKNIHTQKWFPQPNLLRHPNVKAFVTQGGIQSTDEAIRAGVPLVGIPMLGDQWYNVEKYVHLKIGVKLDIETLTEEQFRNAITTVIEDDSYRRNIKRLDVLMRDEPMTGLERAVWWTEYVLRHRGARHLRAPAANISWTQYFELQLVSIVLLALIFVISNNTEQFL